ncbi:MAG: Rab family GTPase [Candidatus Heimdallarchaeota archaeon]
MEQLRIFKIVVIGDSAVGKTSLSMRYSDNSFQYEYIKTIGSNFFVRDLYVEEWRTRLLIWDLAGDELFGRVRPIFYQGSFGALVVFDITRRSTFDHLEGWLEELRANIEWDVPIILAANKVDCDNWELTKAEIKAYSQKKAFPFYLTSAKTDQNVAAAFNRLATEITGVMVKFDSPD